MQNVKGGFVGLLVLVAVAIIAIVYFVQFGGMGGTDPDFDIYSPQPWFHQDRLLRDKDFPVSQTGKGGRTVIEGDVVLTGTVTRQGDERGQIVLKIDSNGAITGSLHCEYAYTESSYTIDAKFKGNIDPAITYQDANGKRKDLLYLIAKGKYQQTQTNINDQLSTIFTEPIFVIGWIENDYTTAGSVFLMTGDDEKSNAEYEWTAQQQ